MHGGSVNELNGRRRKVTQMGALWGKEDRQTVCATAASCDEAEERLPWSKLRPACSSKPLLLGIMPQFRCRDQKDVQKSRRTLTSWRRAQTQSHQSLIWISAKYWKLFFMSLVHNLYRISTNNWEAVSTACRSLPYVRWNSSPCNVHETSWNYYSICPKRLSWSKR